MKNSVKLSHKKNKILNLTLIDINTFKFKTPNLKAKFQYYEPRFRSYWMATNRV